MADNSAAMEIVAVLLAIGLVVGAVGVFWSAERVDAGEVQVVKHHGNPTGEVFEPGLNWKTPIIESTVAIPTRPQTYTLTGSEWDGDTDNNDAVRVITEDGQQVDVDITVRYNVSKDKAVQFHEEYRDFDKVQNDLVRPTVRSELRDQASAISARDVITQDGREQLGVAVREGLQENFRDTGLNLEAVQIRGLELNPEFKQSLEEIEIENANAEQKVIAAEADAEAYNIRNQELTESVLMEMWIEQLDESDTIYVPTDSSGNPELVMDVNNRQDQSITSDNSTEGNSSTASS